MSKASLGGQYALTANYVSLATLLSLPACTLGNLELSIDPSHAATVFIQLSDADHPVQIAAGIGYSHAFHAVDLATISVKGTPGDSIVLIGEEVKRIEQGSMY